MALLKLDLQSIKEGLLEASYLPVLWSTEILVEISGQCVEQDRVVYPALGEGTLHQSSPPHLTIHSLSDAIVGVEE